MAGVIKYSEGGYWVLTLFQLADPFILGVFVLFSPLTAGPDIPNMNHLILSDAHHRICPPREGKDLDLGMVLLNGLICLKSPSLGVYFEDSDQPSILPHRYDLSVVIVGYSLEEGGSLLTNSAAKGVKSDFLGTIPDLDVLPFTSSVNLAVPDPKEAKTGNRTLALEGRQCLDLLIVIILRNHLPEPDNPIIRPRNQYFEILACCQTVNHVKMPIQCLF